MSVDFGHPEARCVSSASSSLPAISRWASPLPARSKAPPEPADVLVSLLHRAPFQSVLLPTDTSLLCQSFTVTPAFERRCTGEPAQGGASVTAPEASQRDAVRKRVRLACLVASVGPVELPLTALHPGHGALFVAGEGNQAARPFAAHPFVAFPVEAARLGAYLRLAAPDQ
jgi:hypothetical protein